MKKFRIIMHETYHVPYIVEADSKEEAIEIVKDAGGDQIWDQAEYCEGSSDLADPEYDVTEVNSADEAEADK